MKRILFLILVTAVLISTCVPAHAAEGRKSTLPENGKTYTIQGTSRYGTQGYTMTTLSIQNDVNHSVFDTVGYPSYFVNTCFTFEEVEDGVFKILPVSMPGWCLQVGDGGGYLPGYITVHAAIFENKPEQLWTLQENGTGYYLSCMSEPDHVLGVVSGRPCPVPMDDKNRITFYFEETTITFPDTQIHVKAPEGWYPGLWVTPKNEDPIEWGGFTIMEKNEDGWFSYPAPWDSSCDCSIVNHAKTGVAAQGYTHDELFDLEDLDFSTDKWVVITDDPNVEGDLTYKIYDYNPDEPLKPDQAYTISIGWPLSIMPEKGLQGTNLMVGGQGDLSLSFYFDKTEDGYYTITPASMPGWRLQLSEGKIITEKPQDIPEQKWSIVACDDGYTISSAADPSLFIGKTTPPADHNQESGDLILSAEPDHKVWKIKESPLAFSEHSVYVKAPEHWAPGLVGDYGSWCAGIMVQQDNGWFSFPLYPYQPQDYRFMITNYMVNAWSSQYGPPDCVVGIHQLEPDKDYWIVISDDPNVDGDLTYKVYDYNPDEESPKTADPVMLALPVVTLLTSATAMICLLRRRKTV